MTSIARHRLWLALVPIIAVALVLGLVMARPAAAADNPISGNQTKEQALGIGPNGDRVCATWSTFDYSPNAVFVRIYDTASQTWTSGSFEVTTSGPSNTGKSKCAIDAAGNTHVVWQECSGQCRIAYRFLPAGANAGNGGSWSQVTTIETDRDGPDIDALYSDPNGKVWLAYRQYPGRFQLRNWSASGGWSGPETVNTGNDNAEKIRIGVDNAGYVSLAWRQGNDGVGYVWRDLNGFISPVTVLGGSGGAGLASLAVDRVTGDVHIIYPKDFTSLYYVKKTGPIGTGFSGQNKIATGSQQILEPRIAWAPTGRLIVAFDNNNKSRIDAIISEDRGGNFGGVFNLVTRGNANSPWVVADSGGGGYVAYNSGGVVYFTTIGGTGPVATPSPSPTPTPEPAPTISSVGSVPNTLNSSTVTWTTDRASSSRVFYAESPASANINTSQSVGDPAYVTSHAITLRGPKPGTTYNYIVRSIGNGGEALDTTQRTFTTPDIEIVGVGGKSYDGKFAALVSPPAGTTKAEWLTSADNFQTTHPIFDGTATVGRTVFGFSGDVTPNGEVGPASFQILVRFNDNPAQTTTATLNYSQGNRPTFSDVGYPPSSDFGAAIYELAGRGIINGFAPDTCAARGLAAPCFGPTDLVARAEAAALVGRSLTWAGEHGINSFSDQGPVDNDLWNTVKILADYGVARGFSDGIYNPTGQVTQGQMLSLISRAMVAKGYWQNQADTGCLSGTSATGQDRQDIVNYCYYIPELSRFFQASNYTAPADRRFVALLLWKSVQWRENLGANAAIYSIP